MKTNVKTQRTRRAPRAAFTLVEVVFASALFATACLAGYSGMIQCSRIIGTMRENLRATEILQDKTEIVRLYTWEQITNSGFVPLTFTNYFNPAGSTDGDTGPAYYGKVTITNAPLTESYAGDMLEVTFQLNWTNDDISHQRQITTLVSRYGLHNYIYGSK